MYWKLFLIGLEGAFGLGSLSLPTFGSIRSVGSVIIVSLSLFFYSIFDYMTTINLFVCNDGELIKNYAKTFKSHIQINLN